MENIQPSELILNPDGSIYHLGLLPEDISDTIITVGDPKRVELISRNFDSIDIKKVKREFITHTGNLNDKRITVISTGIGTDNIDIVINELDALVNIDLQSGHIKDDQSSLELIRLGTSGGIRKDIKTDSVVISRYALGFDGLIHAYQHNIDQDLSSAFLDFCENRIELYTRPYSASASLDLDHDDWKEGITLSCPGFYAPQYRSLRASSITPDFLKQVQNFEFRSLHLSNMEMESSGLFGLANILGHRATSVSAILANRITGKFSSDPRKAVEKLIDQVLEKIA